MSSNKIDINYKSKDKSNTLEMSITPFMADLLMPLFEVRMIQGKGDTDDHGNVNYRFEVTDEEAHCIKQALITACFEINKQGN